MAHSSAEHEFPRLPWAVTLTILLIGGSVSLARDNRPVGSLIRQLGAVDFRDRQEASRLLRERGPEALSELRRAAAHSDPEIRRRSIWLIEQLRAEQYEVSLDQLLSNPREPAPEGLPGWDAFSLHVGDDPSARTLYAGMLRTEPGLLRLFEEDRDSLADLLGRRVEEAAIHLVLRTEASDLSVETLAVFLLLAAEGAGAESPALGSVLPQLIENGPLEGVSRGGGEWEPLQRLLGGWVASADQGAAAQRMRIAARYALPEALLPAVEILQNPAPAPGQRPEAILCVARFGSSEHIPLLETLLDDATDIDTRRSGKEIRFQSRVQDVALAALLHLTGQDPESYGFERLESNSFYVYAPRSVGFRTDEARQEALRKWKTWRAVNRGGLMPVPFNAVEGIGV